jgi:sporulation protein YlmC with PRC-barrel domain
MTRALREVHVEKLLGRRVRDASGRVVGRIEEIHTDDKGVVSEFLLGPAALWERLGQSTLELPFVRLLGLQRSDHRVPWNELDLSDPDHPRTTTQFEE